MSIIYIEKPKKKRICRNVKTRKEKVTEGERYRNIEENFVRRCFEK